MKKSSHTSPSKKKTSTSHPQKEIAPLEAPADLDSPVEETDLAGDQFAVVAREDEATSSGRRVEPIEEDDEHNAEKLIEEGLHGYLRASPNKPRKRSD